VLEIILIWSIPQIALAARRFAKNFGTKGRLEVADIEEQLLLCKKDGGATDNSGGGCAALSPETMQSGALDGIRRP
jgi:hypothetical protein